MRKIYYILVLLGLSFNTTLNAQGVENKTPPGFTRLDRIIVVVNREVITQSQLNTEMERLKKHLERTNQPMPPAGELRAKVLEDLIAKNLQMQLCKAKGIKVTEEDINKTIANIAKANKLTVAQLKVAIEQSGMNYEEYKKQLTDQTLLQKLQQEEVARTVTLTPEDVKEFTRANKDKLNRRYNAFNLVDIIMPITDSSSATQLAEAKKQASDITLQLQKGKEPDEVIKQYPTAEKNDLGWRAIAEVPSLFQGKVASMNVKEVSNPIQAPNGFHILKLVDARGDNVKLSETDIKNLAFQNKVGEAIKDWVQKLRKDAYIQIMN